MMFLERSVVLWVKRQRGERVSAHRGSKDRSRGASRGHLSGFGGAVVDVMNGRDRPPLRCRAVDLN